MEAQTQPLKDTAQGAGSQPQRERRQSRPRNKTTGYYKTDSVPTEEAKPQKEQGTNESNQESQDKSQRQNQRPGNIRGEKTSFQPKGQATQNGESNGTASQSPKENGRSKSRRQKQNNPREEAGTKQNYQKKNQEVPDEQESFNERFDNSDVIEKGQPVVQNPHMAHQIAAAARIQQILPSTLSEEVQEKIRKVKDVVPLTPLDDEAAHHEIYAALDMNDFDEEKAIATLLEANGKTTYNLPRAKWSNIVKKGVSTTGTETQHNKQPRSNSPKFSMNSQTQNVPPPGSSVVEAFVSSGMMDPEMVVQSLTLAIQHQLQMIQEQTKMLTLMQNELTVITQSGTSEREQLLQEEEELRQRKAQLEEELQKVHIRMEQVEQALEDNKKKKADQINTITQNNLVAALLKKSPPLAQLPAPANRDQAQQQRPPRQQGGQRRAYNQ